MAISSALAVRERVEGTVELLHRRGYAACPARLGEVCLGGRLEEAEVLAAVASSSRLMLREGLVVTPDLAGSATSIALRARFHAAHAAGVLPTALRFVRTLVRLNPYVLAVSIAGSLASGGFAASDDVDLNLIVADGRRHLAYLAVNLLGALHALGHPGKPVDDHTRRPLASRFMTANLILELSQCFPLERQDPAMAYELLASRPVHGVELWQQLVEANPELSRHFPQLREPCWCRPPGEPQVRPWLPGWLFPRAADGPARLLGRAGWRWMQWTRRHRPEALARVAYVRWTMRPYALFEDL